MVTYVNIENKKNIKIFKKITIDIYGEQNNA